MDKIISKLTVKDYSNCAIIYARCSTAKQNQDANQSLHTQVGICNAYAAANNLTIVETIQEVARGHNIKKQSYHSITDKYSYTNIIIADASRLSREVGDGSQFLKKCDEAHITIHSVRENIITDSTQDKRKLINSIFDASVESATIGKRISSAIRIRKQLGSHYGKAPYGYKIFNHIDKKSGIKLRKLIEDPKEQLTIQFINKLYYGCNVIDLYKNFKKIKPNTNFKLLDINGVEFIIVYYGQIIIKDIVALLNDNMIEMREDKWKYSDVSTIVRKNLHYHHNYETN
jgi:DNA invertase Pin-like site-specific DNA recombinase